MRRGGWIVVAILVTLIGIGVGVTAYNAGVDAGIEQGLEQAGRSGEVIRVIGDRDGRFFFPFGLLFFPLFLIGIFWLVRAAFWRPWGGGHAGKHGGPWSEEGRARFEDRAREWHQHEHETGGHPTGAGGEPA